jgi:hypothetical protein
MKAKQYLIKVGIRSSEFTYDTELILNNVEYFEKCRKQGLSEYKALLFFNEFLKEKRI